MRRLRNINSIVRGRNRLSRVQARSSKITAGDYAGRLIEQAGLKGMVHGKAQISQRHANFIVNLGGASAADVATLIKEARNRVYQRYGVELELEVELRGNGKGNEGNETNKRAKGFSQLSYQGTSTRDGG